MNSTTETTKRMCDICGKREAAEDWTDEAGYDFDYICHRCAVRVLDAEGYYDV